ncbi:MAG: carboxypeptidase regulatory-like domain-containing protein [Gemmatimonadetes bacterium]|nr:carboxypeptidase regulatory-like domain-containing protein [Gemmatimonadota bacterium]
MRIPRSRRPATALALLLASLVLGCTAELKTLGPYGIPEVPEVPASGVARAAFLAEVNVRTGRIRISAPSTGLGGVEDLADDLSLSLLGGDATLLTTSNFSASAVGAFQPGKVRVSFDIAITNRLSGVDLVGPTVFPAPPPGSTGPLLFPYDIAIAVTAGGTSTGGSGNDVIVVLPSRGLVAASPEWDGAPWNFFNDSSCVGADDCFRYEEFAAIAPGTTTASSRVGFDIDPTVGQFTARLIVAADLADLSPPPLGSVQGSISSPTLGPLAGVTVLATPGGASAITDATGGFTLAGVPVGAVSLTLSGLPPICSAQPGYPVTVQSGIVTSFGLSLTCTAPTLLGTIAGTVTDALGAPLGNVLVAVAPTGLAGEPLVATDAAGQFTALDVDVSDGTGTITLSNLPPACTDPGPLPYSGLVNGGSLTLPLTLTCGP